MNQCQTSLEKLAQVMPVFSLGKQSTQPNYGGLFKCQMSKKRTIVKDYWITKIINNEPYTIVLWSDGTKTSAKCGKDDKYDVEKGLLLCVLKKIVGGDNVAKLLQDWITEQNTITLTDVRKKNKK